MTTSIVDAESVLAIDLGTITTRAILFDVVDGQYNFIAAGKAPTTYLPPFNDISEGVHEAIKQLEQITGRGLVGQDGNLILPAQTNGQGVDRLALTYSTGPQLRMVLTGLLSDVSLSSVQRLAGSVYGKVTETIGMNDRRTPEQQIDAILKADPELVVIGGGTEGGATRSLYRLVDVVNLACRLMPKERRPQILYAGNSAVAERIAENLKPLTGVSVVPNLRPSIDLEDVGPAQQAIHQMLNRQLVTQMGGFEALSMLASTPPIPSAQGFSRVVRFLDRFLNSPTGTLGIDVGSDHTVVTGSTGGHALTSVMPYGLGRGARAALQQTAMPDILRWLSVPIPPDVVRDYLWQKTLTPGLVPADQETLVIEQAFARQVIRLAYQGFLSRYPNMDHLLSPVLMSGAVFAQAASPGQALLMLLDGLQPVGISTFALDQNNLAAGLGAIAGFNPVLPAQAINNALLSLGTVISLVTHARYGSPVVKVRLKIDDGEEVKQEITQGSIAVLRLRPTQTGTLELTSVNRTEFDAYGHGGSLTRKVNGGICGLVIDARGRPLALPPDDARRRDMLRKWAASLNV